MIFALRFVSLWNMLCLQLDRKRLSSLNASILVWFLPPQKVVEISGSYMRAFQRYRLTFSPHPFSQNRGTPGLCKNCDWLHPNYYWNSPLIIVVESMLSLASVLSFESWQYYLAGWLNTQNKQCSRSYKPTCHLVKNREISNELPNCTISNGRPIYGTAGLNVNTCTCD